MKSVPRLENGEGLSAETVLRIRMVGWRFEKVDKTTPSLLMAR